MLVVNAEQSGGTSRAHQEKRHFKFQMPVFRPGTTVMEGNRRETVSHVVLRRRELMVYLVGREEPVKPERLSLEPSWFTTERRPEPLRWFL